ncbi:hypothetical protein TrCOL_g13878 [Triparma columacea]|uniref:Zinc transporter n=1 Tax=Triparma columacea TaxID=722753 RepID=A0A9W7GAJ5_9STRA|nr:hypothetical protein TrCOL_g13878 [Triparma columacea]
MVNTRRRRSAPPKGRSKSPSSKPSTTKKSTPKSSKGSKRGVSVTKSGQDKNKKKSVKKEKEKEEEEDEQVVEDDEKGTKKRGKSRGRSKPKGQKKGDVKKEEKVEEPVFEEEEEEEEGEERGLLVDPNREKVPYQPPGPLTWIGLTLITLISILCYPPTFDPPVTLLQVFYFGWITALSTGLGVVPLVVWREPSEFWLGVSDAVAGGMMAAASMSLAWEGCSFDEPRDITYIPPYIRVIFGVLIGGIFIYSTKSFLDTHEHLKISGITGSDAKRVMLIIIVMTLHSFTEGLGIGVSFGGESGQHLGVFISASLAVHNVPEGLATAIVLYPKGLSLWTIGLWCVCTSLPQPVMAVPSYLMVEVFVPILPIGLGFAGGAMLYVAVDELLPEAKEKIGGWGWTGVIGIVSMGGMCMAQVMLHD